MSDVTLPDVVKRQLEIADQIEKEMLQPVPTDTGTPAADPAPPAAGTTAPPVQPAPAPAAADTAGAADELQRAQHRYSTLQAKYNAEVPRLIEQTRQLQAQLAELTQQRDAAKKVEDTKPLVTEQDADKFGADLLDVIGRKAQEQMRAERAEWAQREKQFQEIIDGLKQSVVQVQQGQGTLSEQAFFSQLDRSLPGWEATNTDPKFLAWLQQPDPMSGMPRQAILDMHVQNRDVTKTANIFSLFSKGTAPANEVVPKPLAQQVTPTSAGGNAPTTPVQSQQKVWSGKEIEEAYDSIRRGRVSDKEAARLIDEIDQAVAEGRVT